MRIYTFFLLLATFLSSYAYDFKQGNLYYTILSEEELTVATAENNDIRNPTYSGDIEIPSHVTYNGKTYTVTEIGGFANSPKVTSVTIPETAVKITHFYGGSTGSQGSGWIIKSISGPGGNGGQTSDGESSLKEIRFNAVNCTSCGFFSMGIPGMSQQTSWSYPFPPSVERIIIGPKVTCLPDYAFYLCTKVKFLTIPASVTTIGKNIIKTESTDPVCQLSELYVEATDFTNKWVLNDPSIVRWKTTTFTSGLVSFINPDAIASTSYDLTVPEGFTTIKKGTFKNDAKLNSIVFPSTITEIGDSAFYNCGVVAVTFAGQSQLKTIGKSVFYDCANLKSVTLPNSLTEIGPSAFGYCKSLETIQFPENIRSIGDYAFSYCNLESVSIHPSCEYLGYGAFSNNANFQKLIISDGEKPLNLIQKFDDLNNIDYNFGRPKYVYVGREIKHDAIEGMGLCEDAFDYTQIIEFGARITEIGEGAFRYNKNLESIIFSETLTTIGEEAFSFCENLKSLDLPESLRTIGIEAFSYCRNLEEVILPDGLQEIEELAFLNTKLKSISIPNTVNRIGNRAFESAPLTNLVIEDGDNPIFAIGWMRADNIYIGREPRIDLERYESNHEWVKFYCENLEIGNSIKALPNSSFSSIAQLKTVKLPESLSSIGSRAFESCKNLTSINIPKSVKSIGTFAFAGCKELDDITLPESLAEIEYSTFYDCSSLKTIILSEGIKKIGVLAFYNCQSLQTIILPESLTELGWKTFADCSSLKTISIPRQIATIPQEGFLGCNSLKYLEIGESVGFIQTNAFSGCPNLSDICIQSITPPKATFFNSVNQPGYLLFDEEVYGKATLSVPEGCVDIYRATAPWNKFFNIREAGIDDVIVDSESESEVIAREYYSIDGRMLGDRLPSVPGHYIECLRHADGKVVTNKIAIR